jgi:hypothetical protein
MNVVARVKELLLTPTRAWRAIERESGETAHLFPYVAVLALIPALAGFIGLSVIGVSVSAGTFRQPLVPGLVSALISYFFSFVIVYLVALVVDFLAPYFGADRYFPNALKLSVYAFTPSWLAGIFLLLPGLRILTVLGLYGFYLMWIGLPILMRAPRDTIVMYIVSIAASTIAIVVILSVVQSTVM